MQVKNRALYNLLRSNWLKDSSLDILPWQIENYRSLSLEELFTRLSKLGLKIDQESFKLYALNCENPEELTATLWLNDDDIEGYDQTYLLVFELWRRLLPDKYSLSLFCDELDYRIDLYEQKELESDELIQESLIRLEDILDANVDENDKPSEAFDLVVSHCAHDLESFLYNYISEQISIGNDLFASELIDGFYDYISDKRWFYFLKARLFAKNSHEESDALLRRLIDPLREDPELDLLLEIACFLVHNGNALIFLQAAQQARFLLSTEEEFQELLAIVADFYRCLDREDREQALQELFIRRSKIDPETKIDPKDPDLEIFDGILIQGLSHIKDS